MSNSSQFKAMPSLCLSAPNAAKAISKPKVWNWNKFTGNCKKKLKPKKKKRFRTVKIKGFGWKWFIQNNIVNLVFVYLFFKYVLLFLEFQYQNLDFVFKFLRPIQVGTFHRIWSRRINSEKLLIKTEKMIILP